MDLAFDLSDRVSLITPARFLFNAGQTPKSWNQKMLNDNHLKVVYFNQKSNEVFPDIDLKGGVVITLRDKTKQSLPIDTFIPYEELKSIFKKVRLKSDFSISEIIFSNSSYKFSGLLYKENPNIKNRLSTGEKYSI
jgi:hypothetical protein